MRNSSLLASSLVLGSMIGVVSPQIATAAPVTTTVSVGAKFGTKHACNNDGTKANEYCQYIADYQCCVTLKAKKKASTSPTYKLDGTTITFTYECNGDKCEDGACAGDPAMEGASSRLP